MTAPRPSLPKLNARSYCFDRFVLDLERVRLMRDGEEIKLRPKSFELLRYLVEQQGRVITKDELIKAVWPDAFVTDDSLVQCVRDIRRALQDDSQEYLKTVPKRGYIFEVPANANGAASIAPEETQRTTIAAKVPSLLTETGAIPDASREVKPRSQARSLRRWIGVGFVMLLAIAVSLTWYPKPKNTTMPQRAIPFTSYHGAERNPALSPDGNTVAFTWNGEAEENFDIYIQPIGSSRPQRLTTDPAEDTSPEWSPDGNKIAFLRRLDANRNQLILIPSAGGPEHVLAETRNRRVGGAPRKNLAWTPDGRWIAVPHRESDESSKGLYLVSVLTGDKRPLTQPPAGYTDENPAFSGHGPTLVFARSPSGGVSDLYLQPLSKDFLPAGPARRRTTDGKASHPVWTGDGRLVYVAGGDSGPLRMILGSTSDLSKTTPIETETSEFSLGRHLVYVQPTGNIEVWRAEVPSRNAPPATPQRFISSTRYDTNPSFSPTGKEIAFLSNRSGSRQIWICNADGTNPVQLTFFDDNPYFPQWKPDGQQILFHKRVAGVAQVFSIPATGGQAKRLTLDTFDNRLASYSRDGNWIYFTSNRSGQDEIWKMPVEGGEPTRLTFSSGKGAMQPIESLDRKTLFYAQGGSEMTIWKIPVQGGTTVQVTGPIAKNTAYAVSKDGIYYKTSSDSPRRQLIQFLGFSTGHIRPVVVTEGEIGLGLSLSPDERYLIFAQRNNGSDLMLIENFVATR